jgi:hypothetical protein
MLLALAGACVACAAVPFTLMLLNLALHKDPPEPCPDMRWISVLIPARNEQANMERVLDELLAARHVRLEVIVCDDHSEDETCAIVEQRIAHCTGIHHLRLIRAAPLPPGWSGKQHACWQLAQAANAQHICFIDADVSITPDAIARAVHFLEGRDAALVSGFPHQVTRSFFEQMLIPLIQFVLLGFLPLSSMRSSRSAAFAAGCGQFFLAKRDAYFHAGGHEAIRNSHHDGITLPRAFRRAGERTDLFDAHTLMSCRMYQGASEVWSGLSKNATEGMAGPRAIWIFTALLGLGQVLPWILFAAIGSTHRGSAMALGCAVLLSLCTRLACYLRQRESWLGVCLHPFACTLLLILQWNAWLDARRGRSTQWRGRVYAPAPN